VNLLRERTRLQERQARAQSLERIRRRAEQIGMRPVQEQQIRYIELPELPAAVETTPVPPDADPD